MSKKHNAQHPERNRSRYPDRLAARGLAKTPRMADIEGSQGLRARQERRDKETGSPVRVVREEEAA